MTDENSSSSSTSNHGSDDGASENGRTETPNVNDVLCGRGGSINSHPGNENFRSLVEKRKRVYLTARFKREKRLIASTIVQEIRNMNPGGRFLAKKGGKDGGAFWHDIGDEKARDKTSQALRENAPTIRLEIETEINQQRDDMKRQEGGANAHHPHHGAPVGHPAHPPPHHQSYWDYYYNYYYGRPPPPSPHGMPPGPPPPGPPPGAHHASPYPPHGMPSGPPPPPHYGWGQQPPHPDYSNSRPHPHQGMDTARSPVPTQPEAEFNGHEISLNNSRSSEEADRRYASALQHQEQVGNFQDRKRHYDANPQKMRNGYSSSFVPVNSKPAAYRPQHEPSHPLMLPPPPQPPQHGGGYHSSRARADAASIQTAGLSQEQIDHKLAVKLQEQEDAFARSQMEATADTSRRTSRSNAYSQVNRVNRDAFTRTSHQAPSQQQQQQQPPDHYAPLNMGSGREDANMKNHQVARATDMGSSLLSQVANQFLGTLGSWDPSSQICPQTSADQSAKVPLPHPGQNPMGPSSVHSVGPSESQCSAPYDPNHSAQLLDSRDHSPPPRVEIDWPSRVGSCNWIPSSLQGANLFGFNTNPRNPNLDSAAHFQNIGISPVNSLEMDVSGTGNSQGSVGGGSLCQVFDPPVDKVLMHMMPPEDVQMMPSPRLISQVPSWERSMISLRSKSPIGMAASLDDEDDSHILVHNAGSSKRPHPEDSYLSPVNDESGRTSRINMRPAPDAMEWE